MGAIAIRRNSNKGIKIRADKGGRTERLYSTATPYVKSKLSSILAKKHISLADWIESKVIAEE